MRKLAESVARLVLLAMALTSTAHCQHVKSQTHSDVLTVENLEGDAETFRLSLDQTDDARYSSLVVVTVAKSQSDCEAAYIDSFMTPYRYTQRGSQLEFEIRDSAGRVVSPSNLASPNVVATEEDDLLRIDAQNPYSQRVDLQRNAFYRYNLPPGRYRVTAILKLTMRSLVKINPAISEHVAHAVGNSMPEVLCGFVDDLVRSETLEIEIR